MSDWISIDEQDPPVNVGILITNGVIVTAARFKGREPSKYAFPRFSGHEFGGGEWDFEFEAGEITHWMLLPPPPPGVTPKPVPEWR